MMPLGAPSISKYGSLVRPDAQIVALRAHSAKCTPSDPAVREKSAVWVTCCCVLLRSHWCPASGGASVHLHIRSVHLHTRRHTRRCYDVPPSAVAQPPGVLLHTAKSKRKPMPNGAGNGLADLWVK